MRGEVEPQGTLFCYFSPESRVPADHPLRRIKTHAEEALRAIGPELDALYSPTGRPSIAPERLLKGQLLIALYSVRGDRAFCEQLDYNLLFRWFLDMGLEEPGLDQSNFSRLRERLVDTDVARRFFDAVIRLARARQLLSAEHFTVDGSLIEAWASMKSLRRKDGTPPKDGGDGTGMADFRGERRGNATHESSTDPEAQTDAQGQWPAGQALLRGPRPDGESLGVVSGPARHRRAARRTSRRPWAARTPGAKAPPPVRLGKTFRETNQRIADTVNDQRQNPEFVKKAKSFKPAMDYARTRIVMGEILRSIILDPSMSFTDSDAADYMHAILSTSCCDYVLLDGKWQDMVQRMERRIARLKLPLKYAYCFSERRNGLENFLLELESHATQQAQPRG